MYIQLLVPVCLVKGGVYVCQRAVVFCVIVLAKVCVPSYFLLSLELVTFLAAMFRFSAIKPEVPSADKKPHPIKTEDRGIEGLSLSCISSCRFLSLISPSFPHIVYSFALFHTFYTFLSKFRALYCSYTVIFLTTNAAVDLLRVNSFSTLSSAAFIVSILSLVKYNF